MAVFIFLKQRIIFFFLDFAQTNLDLSKLFLEKRIAEFLFWKSNKTHEKTNVAIESKKNKSLNLLNPET